MTDHLKPPDWQEALQGHDIVIISPQYWGDYWVSKHWIAFELSQLVRTVFVEPPIWVGGLARNPWKYRTHLNRFFRPVRHIDHKLYVLSPRFMPWGRAGADEEMERQTVESLHKMGVRRPIVLNFGTNFNLVKRINGLATVYYCVDPPFATPGHENDEALTCEASDLVYAVSETYRQHLAGFCTTQPLHVIPHGYAFAHARRIVEDPSASCPPELQSLPRPILGFVGSIHDAYVDVDRVERLAKQRPGASIVLIGPYRNNPLGPDLSEEALRRLRKLPNVHLLGPRHFLDVPRYVKYFDVCLVLVNVKNYADEAMTKKRTHFKWLIYLAMGKPIVAPRVDEADSISSLVYLTRDDEGYLSAIDRALEEGQEKGMPRVNYASQFAFDKTLDAIVNPIVQFLRIAGS